jgi:F0F1-type ATP synthase membrane subunit c/vacuolar-type H+-ATPase subunit K
MEYLIVLGVVATMALYALIIARCLRAPEWQ